MKVAQIDIGYLAGIIDGEGCFSIRHFICAKKHIHHNCPERYACNFIISNTNLNLIKTIKEKWGGFIRKSSRVKTNWKNGYNLVFSDKEVEKIIPLVRSYLVCKKNQADLILQFRKIALDKSHKDTLKRTLQRKEMFEKMHLLNKKGVTL